MTFTEDSESFALINASKTLIRYKSGMYKKSSFDVDLFGESYYNCTEDPYEDLSDFELMDKMVMYVAPREAEKLRMQGHYTGQTLPEYERAEYVVEHLKKLRKKANQNIDKYQLLEEAKNKAKKILIENEAQLKQLESNLIKKEVLTKKEIIEILNNQDQQ